jgi:hypothetical protein
MSRRRAYGGLFVVRGIAGMAFALSGWPPLLIAAALTGTLPTDANESGPITSLEQAMLSGADARMRPRVFGRYNAVAYLCGSVGALAAGGTDRTPPLRADAYELGRHRRSSDESVWSSLQGVASPAASAGQPLYVIGVTRMRERVIQNWILATSLVVGGSKREKSGLATGELVDRGSWHNRRV